MNNDLEMQNTPDHSADPLPEEAAAILGQVQTTDPTATTEEAEPTTPEIPTRDLIAPLVSMFCSVVAPAWQISKAEQGSLTDAYAAVVDKYFPGGIEMGPELGAVLITLAVVSPRLGQPMKDPESEPVPETEPEPGRGDNEA